VFLTNEPNAYTQNDEMFAVLALLRQLLGEARLVRVVYLVE